MNSAKLGVLYGVIIIMLVALSLGFVLSAPTTSGGGLQDPSGIKVLGTIDQTIYADATGWNYSHGTNNPTLYFPLDYKICFCVIEEDNLPHTLTLNYIKSYTPGSAPSSYESTATAYNVIPTIPTTPGAHIKQSYIFFQTGYYVYWCEVHPTTMAAIIQVNATASSAVASNIVSMPIVHGNNNFGIQQTVPAQSLNHFEMVANQAVIKGYETTFSKVI